MRYDLERIPLAEPDNPLVEKYPTDANNIQPRVGATYNLNDGKSVARAGYGRFFDKTHFELIGGLYTGAVQHLERADVPGRRRRSRTAQRSVPRPIRSW